MRTAIIYRTRKTVSFAHLCHIILGCFLLTLLWPAYARDSLSDDELVQKILDGGSVLLLRHAYAPGVGDPPGFQLDECSTQRNLSTAGRRQAMNIGNWLRARGLMHARVYSSQFCRCLDTAKLLNFGPVTPEPALNSFLKHPQDRDKNLAALRKFLANQAENEDTLILVTHRSTIQALLGQHKASGHGIVLEIDADGISRTLGSLAFDE